MKSKASGDSDSSAYRQTCDLVSKIESQYVNKKRIPPKVLIDKLESAIIKINSSYTKSSKPPPDWWQAIKRIDARYKQLQIEKLCRDLHGMLTAIKPSPITVLCDASVRLPSGKCPIDYAKGLLRMGANSDVKPLLRIQTINSDAAVHAEDMKHLLALIVKTIPEEWIANAQKKSLDLRALLKGGTINVESFQRGFEILWMMFQLEMCSHNAKYYNEAYMAQKLSTWNKPEFYDQMAEKFGPFDVVVSVKLSPAERQRRLRQRKKLKALLEPPVKSGPAGKASGKTTQFSGVWSAAVWDAWSSWGKDTMK